MSSQGVFKNLGKALSAKSADAVDSAKTQEEINRVPGAELSAKLDPWWWLVVAVALLIALMVIIKPDPYWDILYFVRDGLGITALLTVLSFVFILMVGLVGGLGRIAKNPVIHFIANFLRGFPTPQQC